MRKVSKTWKSLVLCVGDMGWFGLNLWAPHADTAEITGLGPNSRIFCYNGSRAFHVHPGNRMVWDDSVDTKS